MAAAVASAQQRVDDYTGDLFEAATMTVAARVGGDGSAMLPLRVQSVTGVTTNNGQTTLAAGTYQVETSQVRGGVDRLRLANGRNVLVVGMEPWASAGGMTEGQQLLVTGSFGWTVVPDAVRRATALIAAHITLNPEADATAGLTDVSVEGYTARWQRDQARSTGSAEADQLLQPYRRLPVRVS